MDSKEAKIITSVGCFLSDVTILAWLYWQATNYDHFGELASKVMNSPNFQVQLYKVLLQSLTFFLLLFLAAQLTVYLMAAKKFRAAYLYLKFYSVIGFAISLLIAFSNSLYALCPALFYLAGYYHFAKSFKEATKEIVEAQTQSSPQ